MYVTLRCALLDAVQVQALENNGFWSTVHVASFMKGPLLYCALKQDCLNPEVMRAGAQSKGTTPSPLQPRVHSSVVDQALTKAKA